MSATPETSQPNRIDKYILFEKIAVGGMAEVWLASSTQAGGITKFVAIKKILPHLSKDSSFIDMFKGEAAVAMNLSHSNIVSITGYYQSEATNELYLVMDFVEGRNLRQVLEKMKATDHNFSLSHIVYIIKELAAGLSHAHHSLNSATGQPLNIIHRDISPQNCMISFDGEVKVVDFGISKAEIQRDHTEVGTLKGKFGYMSPEQADGRPVDLRTDIFSLGIIFWELVAGDRLFTGKNEMSILKKIRECQIPELSDYYAGVNPEIERIIRKALAKDPAARYQTASAMHRDLSRFLNTNDPDFTTPDFAVFIRTLFASEVIEARQKLIKYSQEVVNLQSQVPTGTKSSTAVPVATATAIEPANEDRTEIWTFNQGASLAETVITTKKVVGEKFSIKPRATGGASTSALAAEPEEVTEQVVAADNSKNYDNGENHFSIIAKDILKGPNSPPADLVKNSDSVTKLKSAPSAGQKEASVILETKSALAPSKEKQFVQQAKAPAPVTPFPVTSAPVKAPGFGTPSTVSLRQDSVSQRSSGIAQRPASNRPIYTQAVAPSGSSMSSNRIYTLAAIIFLLAAGVFIALKSQIFLPHQEPAIVKAPVVPVKVPDFLLENETANVAQVKAPMTTVLFKSVPSGAEIWIDRGQGFEDTGDTTPSREDLPTDTPFQLKFRKYRYEEFVANNLVASQMGGQFEANLVAQKIAYVDILANRSPRDVKVYINEMQIEEARLPMLRFEVPANMPVKIRIESPATNLKVEKSLNLKEGDRTTAQFIL